MLCTTTLIFHICASSDKSFMWIPTYFTLWPWPWCFTYIMPISFNRILCDWYFTWVFLVTNPFSEMTKIANSIQSHTSYRIYKSENGRTGTSEYIRGGIWCHGGVSNPCWSITPAVIPFSRLGKRYVKISVKNGLTIVMKYIRQHVAQRRVIWVNKIVVMTIKCVESCM
jgi:hypothetical protein